MPTAIQRQAIPHSALVTSRAFLALVTFLFFSPGAFANYVEVRNTANLYADPSTDSAKLATFDPSSSSTPIHLIVLQPERVSGYFRVRTGDGLQGWIYKSRVRHFEGDPPGGADGLAATGSGPLFGGAPQVAALGDQITQLTNTAYAVAYSETRANPLWVAHKVGTRRDHSCPRLERFKVDERTRSGVAHNDYNNSGYDRGHMAPSATVGNEFGCPAQDETYLLSNIAPQLPGLNQKAWGGFENLIQDDYALRFNGVWIVTGPIFDEQFLRRICSEIELPIAFYKIVVRQIQGRPDAIAVIMQQETAPGTPLRELVKSIDEVERLTHIDFFSALPDDIENALEGNVASSSDWRLDTALNTTFDGAPRPKCELPVEPRSSAGPDVDQ